MAGVTGAKGNYAGLDLLTLSLFSLILLIIS